MQKIIETFAGRVKNNIKTKGDTVLNFEQDIKLNSDTESIKS